MRVIGRVWSLDHSGVAAVRRQDIVPVAVDLVRAVAALRVTSTASHILSYTPGGRYDPVPY